MRILVDYRPALRERTGVGEYVHELVRAYTALPEAAGDRVRVFSSSWKDRPRPGLAQELKADVIDRRVPVRLLNYTWHRLEWPPVEWLVGGVDVVHSPHPLLVPARDAAQVITIHDIFFLVHPDRVRAEIRRDYTELVRGHALRAHAVATSSEYGAGQIAAALGVDPARIYICPPGAPAWQRLGRRPHLPREGYILFLGTLEPRKNVGVLLDAYERLLRQEPSPPKLVLAGRVTPDAADWIDRIRQPPLAGRVEHRGYVSDRETLYAGARLLVLPSLEEGFGLPVLEAMSAGVPVVAANRGALPEVLGDAGPLIDPLDVESLAASIRHVVTDDNYARACAEAGLERAATFSWARTAAAVRRMYRDAIARRHGSDIASDRGAA